MFTRERETHGRKRTCQLLVGWIHQVRLSGGRKPLAILALRGVADFRQHERVQTCTDLRCMTADDDESHGTRLACMSTRSAVRCVQTGG